MHFAAGESLLAFHIRSEQATSNVNYCSLTCEEVFTIVYHGEVKKKCVEDLQQCDVSSLSSVSIHSGGDQLGVRSLHIFHPLVYLQYNQCDDSFSYCYL